MKDMPDGPRDSLDSLLRAADPLVLRAERRPDPDTFLQALDRRDEVPSTTKDPRRRRRVAVLWITLGLAAGVGIAAPAAAGVGSFLARTGTYPPAPNSSSETQTEVVPDSEWIDATARDYVDYALTVYDTSLPLPDRYVAEDVAKRVAVHQFEVAAEYGVPVVQQTIGLKRAYESAVRCVWISNWQVAAKSGDRTEQQRSADVMAESATWPATVATDGGGVVDALRSEADGARRGDASMVASAYQSNACEEFMKAIDR